MDLITFSSFWINNTIFSFQINFFTNFGTSLLKSIWTLILDHKRLENILAGFKINQILILQSLIAEAQGLDDVLLLHWCLSDVVIFKPLLLIIIHHLLVVIALVVGGIVLFLVLLVRLLRLK